jgi:hypothetical protein
MNTAERSIVPLAVLNNVQIKFREVDTMLKPLRHMRDVKNAEHWMSRQDIMKMHEVYREIYMELLREAAVCKQRKKVTTQFWNSYNKFNSYRENIVGNITMYSLMYA